MGIISNAALVAITKEAMKQATGEENFDTLDDTTVVELGEKLNIQNGEITNGSPADIFFKGLISRIGQIRIDDRSYVATLPKLFVSPVEWGLMTEFIKFDLSDLMVDEMWNPNGFINYSEQGGPAEGQRIAGIEFGTFKPAIRAKLYKKAHAVMAALTKAREQMFTAFTSLAEYTNFAAGLDISVKNTLELKAEVYALMTVSTGIAVADKNANNIKLLTEFNTETGQSLNRKAALNDPKFIQFALGRIAEVKDNLKRMTMSYNNHETLTFSSDANVILLNKFANKAKFMGRANTFNEELLGIGDYDKVSAWQAVTATNTAPFEFDTASSVSLTAEAWSDITGTESEDPKTINYVIGVIYDRWAMGITVDKKKVTSQYSAARDTTNFFYHALVNYMVNDDYPIVIFTLA